MSLMEKILEAKHQAKWRKEWGAWCCFVACIVGYISMLLALAMGLMFVLNQTTYGWLMLILPVIGIIIRGWYLIYKHWPTK